MEENIYQNIINDYKTYCSSLMKFEQYLYKIYLNLNQNYEKHKGYLIDLKELEKYKNDLLYQVYKTNQNDYDNQIICKIVEQISVDKSFELHKFGLVKIDSAQELVDKLLNNDDEYILINNALWKYICKNGNENEPYIEYNINNSELYFILNNNLSLHFRHNKNILNKACYMPNSISKKRNIDMNITSDDENNAGQFNSNNNKKDNKEKLSNLIDIMIKFYLSEKKISEEAKSLGKEIINLGYLIDKEIIDKWKSYTNYEKIKEIFFLKYLQNDISILTMEQKEEISNFMINNNTNKFEINNDIKIKTLEHLSTEEFITFSKTKSFVLINQELYELINDNNQEKENPIEYKIQNNKIKINFRNLNFEFFLNDNIIFSNLDLNYLILIKFFFCQEIFINKRNSHNEKPNIFVMIDKDLISKIKQNMNYDAFYIHMKNNNIDIKDNNKFIYDNQQIFKIIKSLPKDYINSINKNFDLNQINYDKKLINEKIIGDGENKKILKYINNFEIIDIKFSVILSRIKKDIKNLYNRGYFYYLKDRILIVFQDNETKLFYFEIGYINEQNIFVVEYLIDINYDNQYSKLAYFKKYFNKFNSDFILKNIYQNKVTNTFLLENNICYFFKLYEKEEKPNSIKNLDLLNGNTTQFFVSNYIESKNKNENIKIYLELLIDFYRIDKKIQSKINNNNCEKEYYILNENWIKEFKSIFNYNEILTNEIKGLINNNYEYNYEIADKIINKMPENIRLNLNQIEESNIINKKLNDINLYKINKIPNYNDDFNTMNFLSYNYGLIDEGILESFKKNKININKDDLEKVNCFFLNNKIFLVFKRQENYIINIGHYTDNLLITEIIIITKYKDNINTIIDIFKDNGYNEYMKYLLFENEIYDINGNNNIKIIKISKEIDIYHYKESLINERLKAFIYLSIYQHNIIEKTKESYNIESEDVLLINKNWLDVYGYERINEIINKNIHHNLNYDNVDTLNELIFSLDKKQLKEIKEINNNLVKLEMEVNWFFSTEEKIQLPNNKEIFYYNDFMVVNRKIGRLFLDSFKITNNNDFVKFYSKNKKNFVEIDKDGKHFILLGSILNNEKVFKLEFIFDFKEGYDLHGENNKIYEDYNNYIHNKLIFNNQFENDCISPIFNDNNSIIGYGYKYDNLLRNKFINNYDIKKELINMIQLFIYYNYINSKLEEKNSSIELSSDNYCLVNSNWMNNVKSYYRYELIRNALNSNKEIRNIIDNNKDKYYLYLKELKTIYEIIKKIPNNTLDELNLKIQNKEFKSEINFYPDFIPIKNSQFANLFSFDNFEILNKEIIKLFLNENNNNVNIDEKNFSKIDIVYKYIIVHFSGNVNADGNFISIIGKLNEFTFKIDYILIYNNEHYRESHINNIKLNLEVFLNNYKTYDICEPLFDDSVDEVIGSIIKYNSNNQEFDNYPYNQNINNENYNNYQNFNNKENNFNDNDAKDYNNKINENEYEYNLDYKTHSPHIKDNFAFTPLIGLQNIGATCYMNATLQCFCHIEYFVNKFKYSQNIIDKVRNNKKNLTASFKLLIEKLWPNNYDPSNSPKYYAPNEFKDKISEMNPLFRGVAANDAKDLVNFIIMTLHEELNKVNNSPIINNNVILNQTDKNAMFDNFQHNFKINNQSIISDLFYAINCNKTQCSGCGTKTYNFQTYFFIVFPLEEVRKFKLQKNINNFNQFNGFNFNNMNINNNVVDITDCFDYDCKINVMSGANAMYCNYCKRTCNNSMCTTLTTGPPVLILLLNRGKGIEFEVKINFPEYLNLHNYIQLNHLGCEYRLIGVITHIGESGMGGHFIAYCRDPLFGQWHKYNDAIVTLVNDFQNEVINFAMPYLLFYQKNNK